MLGECDPCGCFSGVDMLLFTYRRWGALMQVCQYVDIDRTVTSVCIALQHYDES